MQAQLQVQKQVRAARAQLRDPRQQQVVLEASRVKQQFEEHADVSQGDAADRCSSPGFFEQKPEKLRPGNHLAMDELELRRLLDEHMVRQSALCDGVGQLEDHMCFRSSALVGW